MRNRKIVTTVLLTAVSMTGAACSSGGSNKTATTTTEAKSKTFQVTSAEGQVSVSLDGELPPNWPDGFPVPSGAEAAGSGSLGNTTKTVMVGVYSTSTRPENTYDFYKSNSDLTVEKLDVRRHRRGVRGLDQDWWLVLRAGRDRGQGERQLHRGRAGDGWPTGLDDGHDVVGAVCSARASVADAGTVLRDRVREVEPGVAQHGDVAVDLGRRCPGGQGGVQRVERLG